MPAFNVLCVDNNIYLNWEDRLENYYIIRYNIKQRYESNIKFIIKTN